MSSVIQSIESSFLYKLLTFGKRALLSFDDTSVDISQNNTKTTIKFDDIKMMTIERGILWDNIRIVRKTNKVHRVDGLNKKVANKFYQLFTQYFANHYYTYFYSQAQKVLSSYPVDSEYFQEEKFKVLVKIAKTEMSGFRFLKEAEDEKYTVSLSKAYNLSQGDISVQKSHNDNFIRLEKQSYKAFFDTVEKNPLTEKQREAVIVNERANLIIAGAGSGKTSVMVARVGYVLDKYKAKPEEILVLAFGREAAIELKERVKERLQLDSIGVTTFHSFGQNVIAQVEGKKPNLAKWEEDESLKSKLVGDILLDLSNRDTKFKNMFLGFFSYPFAQYKSEFSFKTEVEYKLYLQNNKIISLKGDQVKSYEECEIANFLFLNGVEYEYEVLYKHDTATIEYRQYEPDFYLTEYDIYLEHFGIDRKGNTAPFVDKTSYNEGIAWKRELHEQHGTTLIETYSYYHQEGRLLKELERILKEKNVAFVPKSTMEALSSLEDNSHINSFAKTVAAFIGHYKSNSHSIETLRKRAGSSERLNAFLNLFEPILFAYEAIKKSKNVIDFEDMINMAIQYIKAQKYLSQYKYILVDEYQDISTVRAKLVKSLYTQVPKSVLTVVGDDWQSIFRFTGSEISLFHHFEDYFGVARKVQLDYTFRFNDKISSVSQKFIEANPKQIKKSIKTISSKPSPMIHIWWGDDKDLNKIQEILTKAQNENHKSVYILGRNKYAFPDNIKNVKALYPALDINILTTHQSKGREADISIISGVFGGTVGFPTSIQDDVILSLALAEEEPFPHAEERRLFYVALTRAKQEVHILASNTNISPFTEELEDESYEIVHHYKDNIKPRKCPKCRLGVLIAKDGTYGKFWGCTNYGKASCDYTEKMYFCKEKSCGSVMQLDRYKKYYVCSNEICKAKEKACPLCNAKLIMRFVKKQNNRPFMGCSNYGNIGCTYTEDISKN